MKRKINIWNAPLRSPSPEAQKYARDYYGRKKVSVPNPNEGKGQSDPQAKKPESNTPQIVETQPEKIELNDPPDKPSDEKKMPDTVKRYKVLKRHQRRRQAMSISVSEEEEDLLRAGAAAEGMTFSAWARKVLFRAMKTRIPDRPE